jgi:AbiV family abortive infection protein
MTNGADPLPDDPLAFLAELKRGGELIFENAQHLSTEARLLRQNGAIARAVCLHQLSNEECGKIELIGGWAMSVVLGDEVDAKRIAWALRDHKAKNYANAYFSSVTEDERAARERRDWSKAREIFRRRQGEIHELFNTQKNAALYVGFENGRFSAPEDVVTEAFADEIAILNDFFLWIAANNVRLLGSLDSNDWGSRAAATRLVARLEQLRRDQPGNPEAALDTAMQEMFDEVLGDLATKHDRGK